MATSFVTLPAESSWVSASAASDYIIQNLDSDVLHFTVQDTAPAAGAPYHELERRQAFARVSTGTVYVRNPNSYPVRVAVTE